MKNLFARPRCCKAKGRTRYPAWTRRCQEQFRTYFLNYDGDWIIRGGHFTLRISSRLGNNLARG